MNDKINDPEHARHSLSQEFRELSEFCGEGNLNLERILERMHGRGQALIILFLGCPFMLPIPLPGVSILFGILIMIFSLSLGTGWRAYLPRFVLERELPRETLQKFSLAASGFFQRTEKWVKPRLPAVVENRILHGLACLCIGLSGFLLALPLPPGTNFPPAFAIVSLSIGLLERDGVSLICGYILFALNILFFTLLGFMGYEAVLKIFGLQGYFM